jgi:hypothetical protein
MAPGGRPKFPILSFLSVGWLTFYLPHMEYEGSIGFVSKKMEKIADFHVLGIFLAKKYDLSKNNSVCHAPLNAKFVPRLQPTA